MGSLKSYVDRGQVERAVNALLKHHSDKVLKAEADPSLKKSLLDEESEAVRVSFDLSRQLEYESQKRSPESIHLPHRIRRVPLEKEDELSEEEKADYSYVEEAECCLIVKDDSSKQAVQKLICKFPSHLACITKLLTLESLRRKHARFEQRRELLKRFDLFFADDRILPMLTQALGSTFLKAKRQPYPVTLARPKLPFIIRNAVQGTFFLRPAGRGASAKVGNTNTPAHHLVDNIMAAVHRIVTFFPRHWADVATISLQSQTSIALPFYVMSQTFFDHMLALETPTTTKQQQHNNKNNTPASRKRPTSPEQPTPLLTALKKQKKPSTKNKTKKRSREEQEPMDDDDNNEHDDHEEEEEPIPEIDASTPPALEQEQQQQQQQQEEADEKKTTKKKKKKHQTTKNVDEEAITTPTKKDKEEEEVQPSTTSSKKKKNKKKDKKDKSKDKEQDEPPSTPTKTPKDSKSSTTSKTEEKQHKDSSSKKETKPSPSSNKDNEETQEPKSTYIPSKKFKGAKPGYVFKKDVLGVGYYIDRKPKPTFVAVKGGRDGGGRRFGSARKGSKPRGGGKRRRSY